MEIVQGMFLFGYSFCVICPYTFDSAHLSQSLTFVCFHALISLFAIWLPYLIILSLLLSLKDLSERPVMNRFPPGEPVTRIRINKIPGDLPNSSQAGLPNVEVLEVRKSSWMINVSIIFYMILTSKDLKKTWLYIILYIHIAYQIHWRYKMRLQMELDMCLVRKKTFRVRKKNLACSICASGPM